MENNRFVGYRFKKTKKINKNASKNPLAKLSYKELQEVARELHLPAKFKHKVLLALVIAKKQGRQDIVSIILECKNNGPQTKLPLSKLAGNSVYEPQQFSCSTQPSPNMSHFNKAHFTGNISGLDNVVVSNSQDLGGLTGTSNNYYCPNFEQISLLARNSCDPVITSASWDRNGICSNAVEDQNHALLEKAATPSNNLSLLPTPDVSFESEHRSFWNFDTMTITTEVTLDDPSLFDENVLDNKLLEDDNGFEELHEDIPRSATPSNMSLFLTTPSASFDSGNGSFSTFDGFINELSLDM